MKSVVEFLQGCVDLIRMPIIQYRKDGRIVRGLHLGVGSFSRRTLLAVLDFASRLLNLVQVCNKDHVALRLCTPLNVFLYK